MSIALDVATGVVFLYLLLALIVTTVQELLASLFRLRAKHLLDAIAGMLGDAKSADGKPLVEAIYRHPLIRNLTNEALELTDGKPSCRGKGLPSYITSRAFALALVDVLRQEKTATEAVGATRVLAHASEIIATLPSGELKQALELLVGDVETIGANLDERAKLASERLEGWFNDRMARASGWYKRKAQVSSLMIAAVVTLTANADSIHVVNRLWNDAALRAAVVANAQAFVDSPPATDTPPSEGVEAVRELSQRLLRQSNDIEKSGLPVGWKWELKSPSPLPCVRLEANHQLANGGPPSSGPDPVCWDPEWRDYGFLLAGWIITILAVSLGSAFWFDSLSRVLKLRGSGPRVSDANGRVESTQPAHDNS